MGDAARLVRPLTLLSRIGAAVGRERSPVDRFWAAHTVNSTPFATAAESEAYLEWRFTEYPLFCELMDLWGEHDGQVVLDYGCGPGNDVTGFLLYTAAARVIGADVSRKALDLTRRRLELHAVDPLRYDLVELSDARPGIPLADASVGYVHCAGVLQHTGEPLSILHELRRVLLDGGRAKAMVYNRDSVYFHLYTAYQRMVVEGVFPGMTVEEAFSKNTDGPECPVSRCYRPAEFVRLCSAAGFEASFVGAYPARIELELMDTSLAAALDEPRLAAEHREFLRAVTRDADGIPLHGGTPCGVGGVYDLVPR